MATITILAGDFGSELKARAGEEEFFLPERARPGMTMQVPFTAVAEIEAVADDHSGRIKEAGKLALRGVAALGPLGIAAGMFAMRKPKDVKFEVRLSDRRRFGAVTDAVTFASLRADFTKARAHGGASDPDADRVIEKYVRQQKKAAQASHLDEPQVRRPSPPEPVASMAPPEPRRAYTGPERPAFGRRGR
ncbi:hypothetical protein BH10PSE9_BH10PSE9_14210 [soil metagenome]